MCPAAHTHIVQYGPSLLQLKTSLQNGDVIMVPPIKEAQKLLQALVKNVAESSRSFVRWMDGTCLEMPDQRPKGDIDGEPLIMHFSTEVLHMQQVSRLGLVLAVVRVLVCCMLSSL